MTKIYFHLILLFLFTQLNAQNNNQKDSFDTYQRIDASYCFGGQVYNENLIYNPGYSFQSVYGFMPNKYIGFGFGVGYQAFTEHERFIPVYFEAIGLKKDKKNTPVIKMQLGYSIGWHNGTVSMNNYNYQGGIYLDTGIGRKIHINNNLFMLFSCSYRHQFAKMEYEIYGTRNYSEMLNYDMLVISIGLIRE